jgi:tetratricopeptide (TPR) repeat protein
MNEADTAKKIFQKIAGLNDSNFQIKNTSRTHWFPLPAYARFELARLYTSAGQIVESEKLLKDIIQSYITFGPAYRQIGIIYRMKPDSALSKYYTDRANDLTIYTPPVDTLLDKLAMMSRSDVFLMKQIDLAMRSVNSQWAIDLIVQGLKYNHDSKYLISKAIKQFINTGGTKRALPYLAKHLQLYHDDATELMEVGSLLADAGFTEQATEYFQKAESLHIKDPEIRTELALLWFEKTMNKDKAGKLMIEQLDSNKDNAGILFHGVYLFLEMGESELAEKYLNILKRNSSNQPKVWILEGIIAEQNGEIDKAIRLMEQAFKILPADKYLINHLGNLYLREKMWQKSIQFFRKVLDIQPNNSLYQINLGSLLVSCPEAKFRNIPLGVDYCERAYYNYSYALPAKIAAGRALAIAYDELGNPNKAKYYIAHTVELASKVGISKSYMENLESLLKEFSSK